MSEVALSDPLDGRSLAKQHWSRWLKGKGKLPFGPPANELHLYDVPEPEPVSVASGEQPEARKHGLLDAAFPYVAGALAVAVMGGLLVWSVRVTGETARRLDAVPPSSEPTQAAEPEPFRLDGGDLGRVCRATIASLMGRSPSIIHVDRIEDRVAYTSYRRPGDRKLWRNACMAGERRVIWAAVEGSGSAAGIGRWRMSDADEFLTYELKGDDVVITTSYGGEGGASETFRVPARAR